MTRQATRACSLAVSPWPWRCSQPPVSAPGQAQLALTGWPADGNQHARKELLEAR